MVSASAASSPSAPARWTTSLRRRPRLPTSPAPLRLQAQHTRPRRLWRRCPRPTTTSTPAPSASVSASTRHCCVTSPMLSPLRPPPTSARALPPRAISSRRFATASPSAPSAAGTPRRYGYRKTQRASTVCFSPELTTASAIATVDRFSTLSPTRGVAWVGMAAACDKYASSCPLCLTSRNALDRFPHGRMGDYLNVVSAPGDLVVGDFLGPYEPAEFEVYPGVTATARYILVLVDHYSRCTWLHPCRRPPSLQHRLGGPLGPRVGGLRLRRLRHGGPRGSRVGGLRLLRLRRGGLCPRVGLGLRLRLRRGVLCLRVGLGLRIQRCS